MVNINLKEPYLKAVDADKLYDNIKEQIQVLYPQKKMVDKETFEMLIWHNIEAREFTDAQVETRIKMCELQKEVDAYRLKSKAKMWNNLTKVTEYLQSEEGYQWEGIFEGFAFNCIEEKPEEKPMIMEA